MEGERQHAELIGVLCENGHFAGRPNSLACPEDESRLFSINFLTLSSTPRMAKPASSTLDRVKVGLDIPIG